MEDKIEVINSIEAVEAINRSEIDIAIATAKKFPRDIVKAKEEIYELATSSKETAEACFYHIPRKDKKGKEIDITGPSVRLAEIIAYAWTNINAGFRVVGNDGKKITAQAIAYDIERNHREGAEVSQGITYADGRTYNQDMQVMIMNSAGSKAWRNAMFKLIPNAVWIDIQEKIKKFIVGDGKEMLKRRDSLLKKFENLGVSTDQVLKKLNLASIESIDTDVMVKLYGVLTAIGEGTSSVEEVFGTAPVKTDSEDLEDDKPEENKTGKGKQLEMK